MTLLLIFGVIIGNQVLNLIPDVISERFELIANIALLMVGFLLGGKLTAESLKRSGKQILSISISAAVVTTGIVMAGLLLVQVELQIAVILGCIAAATAPAASVDIVIESKINNRFSNWSDHDAASGCGPGYGAGGGSPVS